MKRPRPRTDALQIHLWIDGRDFHSEILEDTASDRKQTYERSEVYTVENGVAMCGTLQFSGLVRHLYIHFWPC